MQANAVLTSIDSTTAKGMPGFVSLLTAADIPGKNTFVTPNYASMTEEVNRIIL